MNRRAVGPTVLAAVVALVTFAGAAALAQEDTAPAAPSASGQAPAPAPGDSSAPAPAASGDAPAGSSAPPAAGARGPVMGYAYGTHSAAAGTPVRHTRMVRHAGEALATFTGFEMLADGGSRLFVQLDRTVDVEQTKDDAVAPKAGRSRKGKRAAAATNRLVFTFKGTELERFNDSNSLETMHFNTPVLRARLVPAGKNLRLVVVLRADATPTLRSVPAKDNGSMVNRLPAGDVSTGGRLHVAGKRDERYQRARPGGVTLE